MSPRSKVTRGICPECDFCGNVRKDGLLPKHRANELCDGEPVPPARIWEAERIGA